MVRTLSVSHKIELIRLVGDNHRTYRAAAAEFNRRHPEIEPVTFQTVAKVNTCFDRTGSIVPTKRTRNVHNRQDNEIMNELQRNPKTSVRQLARNLNLKASKVWRCLKRKNQIAFKPKFLHTLENGDEVSRMEYSLWCQGNFLTDMSFLSRIMFTDEATFTTNGVVSSQNSRYWAEHNPSWVINCKRQYSSKINVWCGILNNKIIGPFFYEGNLNSENFLHFLNNEFWDYLEDIPIILRQSMIFQLDGAPMHNARTVREWLDTKFPGKWIGRNSSHIKWPPRSPDLTPLDYFLWGTLKEKVYRNRPTNVSDLKDKIYEACRSVTQDVLKKVTANCRKRIDRCIAAQGGLIEIGGTNVLPTIS